MNTLQINAIRRTSPINRDRDIFSGYSSSDDGADLSPIQMHANMEVCQVLES